MTLLLHELVDAVEYDQDHVQISKVMRELLALLTMRESRRGSALETAKSVRDTLDNYIEVLEMSVVLNTEHDYPFIAKAPE